MMIVTAQLSRRSGKEWATCSVRVKHIDERTMKSDWDEEVARVTTLCRGESALEAVARTLQELVSGLSVSRDLDSDD